jgi:hypothetical protein
VTSEFVGWGYEEEEAAVVVVVAEGEAPSSGGMVDKDNEGSVEEEFIL